jgi:hypothetical protein
MPTIVNTSSSPRGLPRLSAKDRHWVLQPGVATDIPAFVWDQVQQVAGIQDLIAMGILSVRDTQLAAKEWTPGTVLPQALGSLTEKSALAAVACCERQETLEAWLSTDTRKSVHEALTKRAYALAAASPIAERMELP